MAQDQVKKEHATRKIQPKLRMVRNASRAVNAVRSELCASVAVAPDLAGAAPSVLTNAALEGPAQRLPIPKKWSRAEPDTEEVRVNVFVELTNNSADGEDDGRAVVGADLRDIGTNLYRSGRVVTATMPLSKVAEVVAMDRVARLVLGESLAQPLPERSSKPVAAPNARDRQVGHPGLHHDGEGVLIGLIDVGGFDFAHPDFLVDGRTRFVRIWDQGGDARRPPTNFDYGAEFTDVHLNRAIAAAKGGGPAATLLEPQSQMVDGSHGTHVASIAAGRRGLCPKALIAGVLVSLPDDDLKRRSSFYDSTRIAHAVEYLLGLAWELGKDRPREAGEVPRALPLSINISLGTNGHAHDASSSISRWIDSALAMPGRSICVAAGNAGQDVPEFEGDLGYMTGRIHTSGRVPARGLNYDVDWVVVGNGRLDISENELEIWYGSQDLFSVNVRPPGGPWSGEVGPGEFIENRQLPDGSMLSVYNELYHPVNGSNYIAIYLSPFLDPNPSLIRGVSAGRWTVRLTGVEVRSGEFHGWIERDDPRPFGRVGPQELWNFPSFFAEQSFVDQSSVGSLACGRWVISVGNLDWEAERMSITSSQGPTRDGRFKPEIVAPGTNIVAARGFAGPEALWVGMSGTSMASPFIAGVVGLMLGANPTLSAAQIGGIVQGTARPLPRGDYAWRNDAGFGRIDPAACVMAAAALRAPAKDRSRPANDSRGNGAPVTGARGRRVNR